MIIRITRKILLVSLMILMIIVTIACGIYANYLVVKANGTIEVNHEK